MSILTLAQAGLQDAILTTLTYAYNYYYDSYKFQELGSELCVSWDFALQDWTPRGCETSRDEDNVVTCRCNHLTNFAVLVNICLRQEDCQPSKIESLLTYVSYIGMPISIVCLILTVITLIMFKNLRRKDISKYHIQLSLSLLFMLIVAFLVVTLSAEKVSTLYGGCVAVSMLVHYFALVSMMLMAAEALLMFRKLVTPFDHISTKYNIIVSIVCWFVPALPVLITAIVDLAMGNDPGNDIVVRRENGISLCFLFHTGAFWGAFLAPVLALVLFNMLVFVCISVVLVRQVRRRHSRDKDSSMFKTAIRTTLSLFGVVCLFGLTWLFAILTFSVSFSGLRETFELLFTIFNALQGAFIFLFICILSSDAREGWKSLFSHLLPRKLHQYSSQTGKSSSSNKTTETKTRSKDGFRNPQAKNKNSYTLEESTNLRSLSDTSMGDTDHKEPTPLELWELDPNITEYKLQQTTEEPHNTETAAVTRGKMEGDNIVKSSVTVYVNRMCT